MRFLVVVFMLLAFSVNAWILPPLKFSTRTRTESATSRAAPPRKHLSIKGRDAFLHNNKALLADRSFRERSTSVALLGKETDDDDESNTDLVDNFDAQGFGGYLAPYAIALAASVAVTAAFFTFVLLDY